MNNLERNIVPNQETLQHLGREIRSYDSQSPDPATELVFEDGTKGIYLGTAIHEEAAVDNYFIYDPRRWSVVTVPIFGEEEMDVLNAQFEALKTGVEFFVPTSTDYVVGYKRNRNKPF